MSFPAKENGQYLIFSIAQGFDMLLITDSSMFQSTNDDGHLLTKLCFLYCIRNSIYQTLKGNCQKRYMTLELLLCTNCWAIMDRDISRVSHLNSCYGHHILKQNRQPGHQLHRNYQNSKWMNSKPCQTNHNQTQIHTY
jgi:hypothetical protein